MTGAIKPRGVRTNHTRYNTDCRQTAPLQLLRHRLIGNAIVRHGDGWRGCSGSSSSSLRWRVEVMRVTWRMKMADKGARSMLESGLSGGSKLSHAHSELSSTPSLRFLSYIEHVLAVFAAKYSLHVFSPLTGHETRLISQSHRSSSRARSLVKMQYYHVLPLELSGSAMHARRSMSQHPSFPPHQ